MDDDVLIIVVVLLGVGVGAWLLMRKDTEMPPPPCNVSVSYSGVGVGIPCGAIKDIPGEAIKMATKVPTQVLKPLAGGVAKALGFGSTVTNPNDCDAWGGRGGKIVASRGGTCDPGTGAGTTTTKVSVSPEVTAAKRTTLSAAMRKV